MTNFCTSLTSLAIHIHIRHTMFWNDRIYIMHFHIDLSQDNISTGFVGLHRVQDFIVGLTKRVIIINHRGMIVPGCAIMTSTTSILWNEFQRFIRPRSFPESFPGTPWYLKKGNGNFCYLSIRKMTQLNRWWESQRRRICLIQARVRLEVDFFLAVESQCTSDLVANTSRSGKSHWPSNELVGTI